MTESNPLRLPEMLGGVGGGRVCDKSNLLSHPYPICQPGRKCRNLNLESCLPDDIFIL